MPYTMHACVTVGLAGYIGGFRHQKGTLDACWATLLPAVPWAVGHLLMMDGVVRPELGFVAAARMPV